MNIGLDFSVFGGLHRVFTAYLAISRIHVKIALNVVKAWNFVKIKLLSCRSGTDLGPFRKSYLLFMTASNTGIPRRVKFKKMICLHSKNGSTSLKELIKLIKKYLEPH